MEVNLDGRVTPGVKDLHLNVIAEDQTRVSGQGSSKCRLVGEDTFVPQGYRSEVGSKRRGGREWGVFT